MMMPWHALSGTGFLILGLVRLAQLNLLVHSDSGLASRRRRAGPAARGARGECKTPIALLGLDVLAQQRAHQRIQTQSLKTLDFMQVRVRGLGSLTRRARNRPSKGHPAPKRRRW